MMIDESVIYARISRQSRNFESAGSYFRIPPHIPRIDALDGMEIILILYFDEMRWTALSRKNIYFKNGKDYDSIPIEKVGLEIHNYLFNNVKKGTEFQYIVMESQKKMWVFSPITCSGLENIILMLEHDVEISGIITD